MQTHLPNLSNLHVTHIGAPAQKYRRYEADDERNEGENDVPPQANPANHIPLQADQLPDDIWDRIIAAAAGRDCNTVFKLCAVNTTWSIKCRSESPEFWNPVFEASKFINEQPKLSDIWKWGMTSRKYYKYVCELFNTIKRRRDSTKDLFLDVEEIVRLFSIDDSVRVLSQGTTTGVRYERAV